MQAACPSLSLKGQMGGGAFRVALKHLEMREEQDIPPVSYLSNVLLEDCNCFFLAETL